MAKESRFTVVAFDVSDNRRRRKLVRVLESYGVRAQESVFEAWLDSREQSKMFAEASRQLDQQLDRIALYVLPPTDFSDVVCLGLGSVAQDINHYVL